MEYLIIAYDSEDKNALQRRLAIREQHLEMAKKLLSEGKMLYGAAILDENDKMIGSVCIYNFNSRRELDEWLKTEPYIIAKVWKKITIKSCKVAELFKKGNENVSI